VRNPIISDATMPRGCDKAIKDGKNVERAERLRATERLRAAPCASVYDANVSSQEMLDFCAARNISADVEIIPIQKINEAYERMLRSDIKYRFSIDMASLAAPV
jgi:hypothetical protein